MTREQAKHKIDLLDFYLQNYVNDYGEESHTAMMMAIKALEQQTCEDAVSRQVVLDVIDDIDKTTCMNEYHVIVDAIDKLPSVNTAKKQEPCEDAVSREAVLGLFAQNADAVRPYNKTWEEVKALPSVNPQPKTGHWIFDEILDKHYYCSECKSMGVDYWDFCPYCGAKMVEPQESEG